MQADLSDARDLADLLFRFYSHTEPEIREFEQAVEEFGQRVPTSPAAWRTKSARRTSTTAHSRRRSPSSSPSAGFAQPNISREAWMRCWCSICSPSAFFRTIFDNPEFTRRNAIAAEWSA